ncbi:TadE/TadG family type IV pilus assembly protein [Paenibacillus senegalimassiliensis]|uniref:TadE/TadG family type IV pilus assembly protein n=1 Tax=Paenibacillus senegalimassiliensis TaxID=1737426 RepID=UPI00073EDAC0|nr:TadE family protein [Paenibacillus senegalimassiliensis]
MRLRRDSRGSFTLEASLVLPFIFLAVLVLLFFCLYMYQHTLLGQAAAAASERVAYVWDNSERDDLTGAYAEGRYDSLYWRLTDDGMLRSIFGWNEDGGAARVALPMTSGVETQGLPMTKLSRTGGKLPAGIQGELRYDNGLLLRKVTVALERLIPLAPLERWMGDARQSGRADAYVVEPVEWIRTVELARYYGAKFKKSKTKGGMDQQEARDALKLFAK